MNLFLVVCALAIASASAYVKRDAPAQSTDLDINKAFDSLKKGIDSMVEKLTQGDLQKAITKASEDAGKSFTAAADKLQDEIKKAAPEAQEQLKNLQAQVQKAAQDLKENVNVKQFEKVITDFTASTKSLQDSVEPQIQAARKKIEQATSQILQTASKAFNDVTEQISQAMAGN